MHEYYKKKEKALKKDLNNFMQLIKNELENDLKMPFSQILTEIWDVYYNKLAEHFPYIGGDKEPGTKNLTGAFCFIAMGEVCKNHGIDIDRWGELTTLCYERLYEKFPLFLRKFVGRRFSKGKMMYKMFCKKDIKSKELFKKYPYSFVTETKEPDTKYNLIYHMTNCPIALLAKELDLKEYMPYICNLDYVGFYTMGIRFEREKTCADNDGFCDFKFCRQGEPVPFKPCNKLNPQNPYK